MNRGCIAETDLKVLSNNFRVIKDLSGNLPVIAVVKADAYGHGAVEISRRLAGDGVEYLAVAFTEEAAELREAGITVPVLVLFDPDFGDIIRYGLVPVISSRKTAVALSKKAEGAGIRIPVHVKVDTGMGRLGVMGDAVGEILDLAELKGLRIDGVMSHFSEADLSSAGFAKTQVQKFADLRSGLLQKGVGIKMFHMANSAAVMTIPESYFDAVRPGLMLYGYSPLQKTEDADRRRGSGSQKSEVRQKQDLVPVMSVKTRILSLRRLPPGSPISYGRTFITRRDSLVGVIAAGYADGFSRKLSNNAEVLVRGRRVPVIGRVCMDLSMIDVTDLDGVEEGDEVVVLGRQGNEFIDASELAARADTIPYEILTSLGRLSKKVYIT